MSRITALERSAAAPAAQEMLDVVQATLGMTPNLMKTLAASPAALKGYLDLDQTLAGGVLDRQLREQIAVAVAQANGCAYCLAAHHALGALAGLTVDELTQSRSARSSDRRRSAALQFAAAVLADRGAVTDAALAKVRAAGFGDAEILEIIAHVALNVLTNYVNNVARTAVEFPPVAALATV